MASLKDLINGVRNSFANRQQDVLEQEEHTRRPTEAELVRLVDGNKLDELKDAFERHDLDTTNLLHHVGSPEMVDLLVKNGADVNQRFKDTPEAVEDPENYFWGKDHLTPLQGAAQLCDVPTIERLIHHGADVNAGYDEEGSSALMKAMHNRHGQQGEVVQTLINAGADVQGTTVLDFAVAQQAPVGTLTTLLGKYVKDDKLDELKEAFESYDLDTTNLLHSVRSPDMVDFLVEKGADVNQPFDGPIHEDDLSIYSPSPLMSAAQNANAATVQRLLHHGANPDYEGQSTGHDNPLHRAILRDDDQQEAVVRTLLEAGATLDRGWGYTAVLPEAVTKGATVGAISALLVHGADPDQQDDDLMTPLHLAARHGRIDVAELLLDYGADPMARNIQDETALHVGTADPGMVDTLVTRSSDPYALLNATDEKGDTALTKAAYSGRIEATAKLLDLGADPELAMNGESWQQANEMVRSDPDPGRKEAMRLVRVHTVEKEKAALRQTLAEVEKDTSPEVAEQPVARRRARL